MLVGVSMTSAGSAGVILAPIPAAVTVMGWAFLAERITARSALAVACAGAGMAMLARARSDAGTSPAGGVLLATLPAGKAASGKNDISQ